jgi:hypothetical protein
VSLEWLTAYSVWLRAHTIAFRTWCRYFGIDLVYLGTLRSFYSNMLSPLNGELFLYLLLHWTIWLSFALGPKVGKLLSHILRIDHISLGYYNQKNMCSLENGERNESGLLGQMVIFALGLGGKLLSYVLRSEKKLMLQKVCLEIFYTFGALNDVIYIIRWVK